MKESQPASTMTSHTFSNLRIKNMKFEHIKLQKLWKYYLKQSGTLQTTSSISYKASSKLPRDTTILSLKYTSILH